MEKFYRKEGTKMKLIWKELLHANYRCGRMRTNRAQMKYELDDTREKMREKLEDLTERIDRFL